MGIAGNVSGVIGGARVYLEVIARRFADALTMWDRDPEAKSAARPRRLSARAAIQVLAGQAESAKSEAEEARGLLEKRLNERPDDSFAMTELAWVHLALGRDADALRIARQAADLLPIEKDTFSGANFQVGLAEIEARAGAPEEAIKRLRHLLAIPSAISIARLKIDPVWDPIRNDLGFQQLLAGTEHVGP